MAERFSDRIQHCDMCLKKDCAYNRVGNMKGCHWVTALCKICRPKFEKREKDFIDWLEPSTK